MTALRKNDPARMFRPVDLSQPGALDELLSLHRLVFGGYRMEDDAGDGGDGGTGDKSKGGDDFAAITSQEEFDKRLSERLTRERAKFADYADLKAKAEAHDKALADAMTEQEKAVAAARAEGESAASAAANTRLSSAEARALAAAAKFRNPALAVKAIDLSGVKIKDDGEVDEAAIKTLLKELSDAEPYLVDDGKGGKPKPDHSQGGGGGGDDAPSVSRGRDMYAASRGKKQAS